MIRQRIALRSTARAQIVRALTVVLGLILVWYGLMAVLLAVKVAPHTVNAISGYRTLYNDAAGLTAQDFTTTRRLIAGFAGLLAFLVLLYFALGERPRPYLARGEVALGDSARGNTVIRPRAFERVAEAAAAAHPNVADASGRLGDGELNLAVDVKRAGGVAEALRDVRGRVRADLERHELPSLPVNVTVTGYVRKNRRELS